MGNKRFMDDLSVTIGNRTISLKDRQTLSEAKMNNSAEGKKLDNLKHEKDELSVWLTSSVNITEQLTTPLLTSLNILLDIEKFPKEISIISENERDLRSVTLNTVDPTKVLIGATDIRILEVSKPEIWFSRPFPWNNYGVVYDIAKNGFFKSGQLSIAKQNNAISIPLNISNIDSPAVSQVSDENAGGIFKNGTLYFMDRFQRQSSIDLGIGDSLPTIINKVVSSVPFVYPAAETQDDGIISLVFRSEGYGANAAFTIVDPNNILPDNGFIPYLSPARDLVNITLEVGDNLLKIAKKINQYTESTQLLAEVRPISTKSVHKQYILVLKSTYLGSGNAFRLYDDNLTMPFDPSITNVGTVLNDVFKVDPHNAGNSAIIEKARDGSVEIDGIMTYMNNYRSQSDLLEIGGIEVSINSQPASSFAISVKYNDNGIITEVKSWVSRYNELFQQVQAMLDKQAKNANNYNSWFNNILNMNKNIKFPEELGIKLADKPGIMNTLPELTVDTGKLQEMLFNNPAKVQELLGGKCYSSASNLIIINNSNNLFKIEYTRLSRSYHLSSYGHFRLSALPNIKPKVWRSVSNKFSNSSNVVVDGNGNYGGFAPGIFYVNGYAIHIKKGQSLQDITTTINDKSSFTGVTALIENVDDGVVIRLGPRRNPKTQVIDFSDQEKFNNLQIHDPSTILSGVFQTYAKSNVLTNNLSAGLSGVHSGNFIINGQQINVEKNNPSIEELISYINAVSDHTGIAAAIEGALGNGGIEWLLVLEIIDIDVANISVDDPDSVIDGVNWSFFATPAVSGIKDFYDNSRTLGLTMLIYDHDDDYRSYLPIIIRNLGVKSIYCPTNIAAGARIQINEQIVEVSDDNSIAGIIEAMNMLSGVKALPIIDNNGFYNIVVYSTEKKVLTIAEENNPLLLSGAMIERVQDKLIYVKNGGKNIDSGAELIVMNWEHDFITISGMPTISYLPHPEIDGGALAIDAELSVYGGVIKSVTSLIQQIQGLLSTDRVQATQKKNRLEQDIANAKDQYDKVRQKWEQQYSEMTINTEIAAMTKEAIDKILRDNNKKKDDDL